MLVLNGVYCEHSYISMIEIQQRAIIRLFDKKKNVFPRITLETSKHDLEVIEKSYFELSQCRNIFLK